jgi:hypothetical protein
MEDVRTKGALGTYKRDEKHIKNISEREKATWETWV